METNPTSIINSDDEIVNKGRKLFKKQAKLLIVWLLILVLLFKIFPFFVTHIIAPNGLGAFIIAMFVFSSIVFLFFVIGVVWLVILAVKGIKIYIELRKINQKNEKLLFTSITIFIIMLLLLGAYLFIKNKENKILEKETFPSEMISKNDMSISDFKIICTQKNGMYGEIEYPPAKSCKTESKVYWLK